MAKISEESWRHPSNWPEVTVCDQCLRASCWQGEFMCDEARSAGTIQKTRAELGTLGLESSHYWNR